jgi:hypothetical protein
VTSATASRNQATRPGRLLAWVRRWQQRLSDHVHATGDSPTRRHGWQVTLVTGRAGFDGPIYRDPRVGRLAALRATPLLADATGPDARPGGNQ